MRRLAAPIEMRDHGKMLHQLPPHCLWSVWYHHHPGQTAHHCISKSLSHQSQGGAYGRVGGVNETSCCRAARPSRCKFALRAQVLGKRAEARGHGLEEVAPQPGSGLLRRRATRDLVGSVELDPGLVRQAELDLVSGAGLAEPPEELLHLGGLGMPAGSGSPGHRVVGLDEETAAAQALAPHFDDPQDAEQLAPVDGPSLLRPGELQPRLLALAAQVDQLPAPEVARVGPCLDRRARPGRRADGHTVVGLQLLVPPVEIAPERVAQSHGSPSAVLRANFPSLPLDLEADEGG